MRLPAAGAITLVALLVLGLATACGSRSTKADPKQMVLQLQDLPMGFHARSGSGYTPSLAAPNESVVNAAQYKAWGYVTGYAANFSKNSSVAVGTGLITSTAIVYRTSAGPEKSLASTVRVCSRPPLHELSLGTRIGDEAHLCVMAIMRGGMNVNTYALMWRRGRIAASIAVSGSAGTPKQAVALAELQDNRIK